MINDSFADQRDVARLAEESVFRKDTFAFLDFLIRAHKLRLDNVWRGAFSLNLFSPVTALSKVPRALQCMPSSIQNSLFTFTCICFKTDPNTVQFPCICLQNIVCISTLLLHLHVLFFNIHHHRNTPPFSIGDNSSHRFWTTYSFLAVDMPVSNKAFAKKLHGSIAGPVSMLEAGIKIQKKTQPIHQALPDRQSTGDKPGLCRPTCRSDPFIGFL